MDALNKTHYFTALTLSVLIGLALWLITPTPNQQILILLLFAGIIGVPHGITDFALLHALAKRFGYSGNLIKLRLIGALFYLFMIGAFLLFWQWLPLAALVVFLFLSIWHFGEQDAGAHQIQGSGRNLQAALRGLFLIGIIYIAHAETAAYFNLLIASEWFIPLPYGETLAVGGAALYILLSAMTKSWSYIIESACIMLMCIFLAPLISFTLYFCLWHTPRHYIALHEKKNGAMIVYINILLAVVIIICYEIHISTAQPLDKTYIVLFFKLLSCLSFAHVMSNKIGVAGADSKLRIGRGKNA